MILASNVTGMIDLAFVDRADLKRYIGPPSAEAAYGILRGSALELMSKRVVAHDNIRAGFRNPDAAAGQVTTHVNLRLVCKLKTIV